MTIDEWLADKCGIRYDEAFGTIYYNGKNGLEGDIWTIDDPGCREIIREKFGISTEYDLLGTWTVGNAGEGVFCQGETIEEAELACLQAIYDARDK